MWQSANGINITLHLLTDHHGNVNINKKYEKGFSPVCSLQHQNNTCLRNSSHIAHGKAICPHGFLDVSKDFLSMRIFFQKYHVGCPQPPIKWVLWASSLSVKLPVHEADHSPPSSAEVKNVCIYTSTPTISLQGIVLT
jgi:hypothetical protein